MFSNTKSQLKMVNSHTIWDLVASHIFMWHINLFTFYRTFLARGNKNGTVMDLIVMCDKTGTIKYSSKIDKFCQIAELCELGHFSLTSRHWEN